MAEIIRTENLRYAYPVEEGETPVYALKGVDLGIARGSFVVVLGHNGSGKSTLAKMLNAVLVPTEGSVLVEGMDTADERLLLAIRQRVGMVFKIRITRLWPMWWKKMWLLRRRTWGFRRRRSAAG